LISENFRISVVAGLTAKVLLKVLSTNNTVYLVEYEMHWLMNLPLINYWSMRIGHPFLVSIISKQISINFKIQLS